MSDDAIDRLNKMIREEAPDNYRIKNIMPVSDIWIRGEFEGEFWFHKAIGLAVVETYQKKSGKVCDDVMVYLSRLDVEEGINIHEIQRLEDIFFEYEMNPEDLRKAKAHPCQQTEPPP